VITSGDIEKFYNDVSALRLKFPVADIARATGQSKANVSKYLSKKLEPSESFLNAFYEKFQLNGKNVSREKTESSEKSDYWKDKYIALLEKQLEYAQDFNSIKVSLEEIIANQIVIAAAQHGYQEWWVDQWPHKGKNAKQAQRELVDRVKATVARIEKEGMSFLMEGS
jgi:transcriptional regulator with XRE-family HTH domain